MLAVGSNGVGKTNLLESLHVGTQGFSPRTRAEGQLIRFGDTSADAWAARVDELGEGAGMRLGAAVHSVRAVDEAGIVRVARWAECFRSSAWVLGGQ